MAFCAMLFIFFGTILGFSASVLAQAELINSNLVLSGHLNSCQASGPVNTYACTLERTIQAYHARTCYSFLAHASNTGPSTVNYSGLGAVPIVKLQGSITTPLVADDIRTGQIVVTCYDGTNMQAVSALGNAPTGAVTILTGQTGRAAYYTGTAGMDDSTGLTFDATSILTHVHHVTPSSASITPLGVHNVIACDATGGARTYTLPAATSMTPGQSYRVIKVDSSANACIIAPASGERLNGVVSGTMSVTGMYEEVAVLLLSTTTPNWQALRSLLPSQDQTLYMPAGAMDVSGGCAVQPSAALVTNGPKLVTITCTDADTDSIEFDWVMPPTWNGGTMTVELVAFSVGNNTGEVLAMDFAGQCVSSGGSPAAHSTTGEQRASITWGNTANREQRATTPALTLQGSCVAGDHVYMRGQMRAGPTTMTPLSESKLLGVTIRYTILRP